MPENEGLAKIRVRMGLGVGRQVSNKSQSFFPSASEVSKSAPRAKLRPCMSSCLAGVVRSWKADLVGRCEVKARMHMPWKRKNKHKAWLTCGPCFVHVSGLQVTGQAEAGSEQLG